MSSMEVGSNWQSYLEERAAKSGVSSPDLLHAWERDVKRRGGRRARLGWTSYDDIAEDFSRRGVSVLDYRVDPASFRAYVEESGYDRMEYYDGGRRPFAMQKYLEHFVSIELLKPNRAEVFIDVASCNSPFPEIVAKRVGCRMYRQDLWYEPGVHGDRIGGDAGDLPLPPGFADRMTLHNSFEHFEGDSDGRFVREASRVLRPGGSVCIVPLYTNVTYSVQTDPAVWQEDRPRFDPDALVCLAPDWGESYGRFYDVASFRDRIVGNLGDLELRLYRLENFSELAPGCWLRFAAVFTKPSRVSGSVSSSG